MKVVVINITDASAKVGKTNVALNFLRDTSTDTAVLARSNGKKKCAVISRNPSVPEEILRELYRGTMSNRILNIVCKYFLWNHTCAILFILPHHSWHAGVLSPEKQRQMQDRSHRQKTVSSNALQGHKENQ